MRVRSNEMFEAVHFIGQEKVFGYPVVSDGRIFSFRLSKTNIGFDYGDWILKRIKTFDQSNYSVFSTISDEDFKVRYSRI